MQNLATSVRNAMVDAACDLLDNGVGDPTMEIRTAGDSNLLVITLHATDAVAAAVAGVGTFNAPQSGGGSWATFSQNPTAAGTAGKAVCCDGDGNDLYELTVGTGSAEVNFDTLIFDTAVAVKTTIAPTITQPAS
jgi:hypothetical protein